MEEKIWYEMMHTKLGDNYLGHYLNKQKTTRKWFKIITLLFSSGGIFSWAIWKIGILPFIACIIVSTIQLSNLIENHIIISDNDIDKIAELRNKYITYFNKLEKLWMDFKTTELTEQQAKEEFYKLRQIGAEIEASDNKLQIRNIKSLYNTADLETRNYFNQYHS